MDQETTSNMPKWHASCNMYIGAGKPKGCYNALQYTGTQPESDDSARNPERMLKAGGADESWS
jgi:hypothetical protein